MLTTKMIIDQLSPVNRAKFLTKCLNANGYDPLSVETMINAFRTSELTTNSDCPKYKKTTSFSHSGFLRNLRPELLAVILPVVNNPSALRMIHGSMEEGFRTKSDFDQINPYYWPMSEQMVAAATGTFEDIMGMDISELVPDGLLREFDISPKIVLSGFKEPTEFIIGKEPTSEVVQETVQETVQEPKIEAIALNKDLLPIANSALSQATYGKHASLEDLLKSHEGQADSIKQLQGRVEELGKAANVIAPSNDMPKGDLVKRRTSEVFPNNKSKFLPEYVTCWEWDGPNTHVPVVDPHYVFVDSDLATYLQAREDNLNCWIHGDTGCGKSTFAQQVDARTGTMNHRVNFDTDITRTEFVGTHAVVIEGGQQVTKFVDGILPRAMQQPSTLLLDEADAIRPDIAYVLQPVLEHGCLRLLEDGGRTIVPHPNFRIVSTANSAGSGDMSGLYASAVQAQSAATRNRYDVFIRMDYLSAHAEVKLICKTHELSKPAADRLKDFISKYRAAFKTGEIQEPLSPRNTFVLANLIHKWQPQVGLDLAFERAVTFNLTNRVDEQQRAVIVGLGDRVTT